MCVGYKCVSGASVCRVHVCVGCMCVSGASVLGCMYVSDASVCREHEISGTCNPDSDHPFNMYLSF